MPRQGVVSFKVTKRFDQVKIRITVRPKAILEWRKVMPAFANKFTAVAPDSA
jgi:hypothetical protein